jgi:hypothetical protein
VACSKCAIELKFRLWDSRPLDTDALIRQRLKPQQDCSSCVPTNSIIYQLVGSIGEEAGFSELGLPTQRDCRGLAPLCSHCLSNRCLLLLPGESTGNHRYHCQHDCRR